MLFVNTTDFFSPMKMADRHFTTTLPFMLVALVATLFVANLGVAALAEEPLSFSDLETLMSGGVAQRRITEMVKERGINFDLTEESREKLKKAGAGSQLIQLLELAAIRFRLARGVGKPKLDDSTKNQRRTDE